jgi:hypothetical protein
VIAARITEPPVGASTCASGSHVCTGHIGTLTANDSANAMKIRICAVSDSGRCHHSTIENVSDTL